LTCIAGTKTYDLQCFFSGKIREKSLSH